MPLEGRLVGAVIAAVVLMVFWHAGRLRAEATPQGVTVFGYMRKISLPWNVVEAVALRGSLRIQVRGGRSIIVPGFKPGVAQAAAGNRPGRKALAKLAACKDAGIVDLSSYTPVKYEPYVDVWIFIASLLAFLAIALI
jgi:Bacterial PH domain